MNLQDFYDHIKSALNSFDLRFHEMHKVKLTIDGDWFVLSYERKSISIHKDWK